MTQERLCNNSLIEMGPLRILIVIQVKLLSRYLEVRCSLVTQSLHYPCDSITARMLSRTGFSVTICVHYNANPEKSTCRGHSKPRRPWAIVNEHYCEGVKVISKSTWYNLLIDLLLCWGDYCCPCVHIWRGRWWLLIVYALTRCRDGSLHTISLTQWTCQYVHLFGKYSTRITE